MFSHPFSFPNKLWFMFAAGGDLAFGPRLIYIEEAASKTRDHTISSNPVTTFMSLFWMFKRFEGQLLPQRFEVPHSHFQFLLIHSNFLNKTN